MKLNPICVAVVFCASVTGCEKTNYAPGFSRKAFESVAVGQSIDDVLARLGPPLRVVAWTKDQANYHIGPGADSLSEVVPLSNVHQRTLDPRIYLKLEYSLQADSLTSYWVYAVNIEQGHVERI